MAELIIEKTVRFEAAHHLPHMPVGHKCRNVHGHSYTLTVQVRGPVDPKSGIVWDFAELSASIEHLTSQWDHQPLNDHVPNPTGENLVLLIVAHLREFLPRGLHLHGVRLAEGENNASVWEPGL